MTLKKGFLLYQNKLTLSRIQILTGLAIWLFSSFILYAFFQLLREAIRIQTGELTGSMVIMSPRENYLYNIFFAAIAAALGYSMALRFVLQNSSVYRSPKTKSRLRRTLFTETNFSWSFIQWFGKVAFVLGLQYMVFYLQFDLDILKEYSIFLILLPIVLFYSSWPEFSRLIIKKAQWFLASTILFGIISFSFAFKNFSDYQLNNEKYIRSRLSLIYDLQLPESQYMEGKVLKFSNTINLYVLKDTTYNKGRIFLDDYFVVDKQL